MLSGIKVYKVKDFIRKTETGKIDFERSKKIIRELAKAAGSHANHNILIDLRETTVLASSIEDVMKAALEFGSYVSSFKNKIANIIPDDLERMTIATRLKACMDIQGFEYEIFTDYESAIEWLSQTEDLDQTTT
ncbi:MAG: STAS/SEC14 domain-containing protein [Desulfobacterales bacterium]|nr:STAS/SEC14 domain-containing protein [Desulfobacterales bacterium]